MSNTNHLVLRAKWHALIALANAQGHYTKARMLRRASNHMETYS